MHFNCLFFVAVGLRDALRGWHRAPRRASRQMHAARGPSSNPVCRTCNPRWRVSIRWRRWPARWRNHLWIQLDYSILWPWLTSLALRFNSVWSFASYEHSTRARCIWSVLTCNGMDWFGLWPPPALVLLLLVPAPPRDPAALDLLPTSCRSSGAYGVGPPKLRDAERF